MIEDAPAQRLGRVSRLQHFHQRDARSIDHAMPAIVFRDSAPLTPRQQMTLYMQEMARLGIFCGSGFNLCLAHRDKEVDAVLAAADEALALVRTAINDGNIARYLIAEEQRPLFQRRMV